MKMKHLMTSFLIAVMMIPLLFPYPASSADNSPASITFADGTKVSLSKDTDNWYIKVYVDGQLDQDVQLEKATNQVTGTVSGGQKSVNYNASQYYEEGGSGGYAETTNFFHYIDDKYSEQWNRSGTLYGESMIDYGEIHQLEFSAGTLISAVVGALLALLNPFAVSTVLVLDLVFGFVTGLSLGVLTEYVFGTIFVKIYRNTHWVYSEGILGLKTVDEKYYADVNRDTPEPDSYTKYVGSDGFNYTNEEMLDIGIYNAYLAEN